MSLRPLGTTGLSIAPLVLGGNVFGWTADRSASFAILDAFIAGGGTMIDTADVYSAFAPGNVGGESETILGAWLRARGRRDDVQIATKVGMLSGTGGDKLAPGRIAAAIDESLARLGTDYVDLYYAHQDDEDVPQEAVAAAFDALVRAGKVRTLGASKFSAARLESALDISARGGLAAYGVFQPLYNLVSRDSFEGELQALTIARTIAVLPFYGLASGFLTGKYRTQADLQGARASRVAPMLDARGLTVLAAMDAVAAETGATLPQIALAWLMAKPGVTAPIASATSVAQMEELLGAMHLTLSAAQIARLDAAGA